jgi:hypothetical protein
MHTALLPVFTRAQRKPFLYFYLFRSTPLIYRPDFAKFYHPASRSRSPANSYNSMAFGEQRPAGGIMEPAVTTTIQQEAFRAAGRERGAKYTRPSEKRKLRIRIRKKESESAGRVSFLLCHFPCTFGSAFPGASLSAVCSSYNPPGTLHTQVAS